MSKNKLAAIIVACTIVIVVAIVLFTFKPWEGTPSTETYKLTTSVSPSGAGSVSPSGGEYESGVQVTVTASPDSGFTFSHWSGNVSTIADINAAATTITMNGDYTITANFAQSPTTEYDLIINSTEGGSVTSPGYVYLQGVFTYNEGDVVNLVAVAEEGYHFVNWTGDVGTISDVNDATTTITMNGDYTITANFLEGIEIWDWYDLDAIREDLDGYYFLMNDLDSTTAGYEELASPTANGGNGWQPIGSFTDSFTGTFDGQGYEIRDLFINRPDKYSVGLFDWVGQDGVIKDIGVVNVIVTGYDNVGGLVGWSYGTVDNSYSTGSVTGTVSAHEPGDFGGVGGVVGINAGNVSHCYSTGSVTGYEAVGGLVGYSYGGTVSYSYSTSSVTGNSSGGLVGFNREGTVSNSFWDAETSGQATSDGGDGKTTEEMMNFDTFDGVGWDIIAVDPGETDDAYTWNIVDDVTYPFLSWQS